MNMFTSRYMFVNAILMSCCSSLISSESCLGSEDESLLSGRCMESTLQILETRLKAKPLRCPVGWKEFAHHCYNFITTKLPWNEAEVFGSHSYLDGTYTKIHTKRSYILWSPCPWACQQLGGYLVKMNDETENNWLKQQAKDLDDSFWLGGADFTEGDWIWIVDFSNVIFTDWISGQPDNTKESEDCLHIIKAYQYKWNDCQCSTYMSYICESEKDGARIPYSKPFPS